MKIRFTAILLSALTISSAHAQLRPQHQFALTAGHVAEAIVKALLQEGVTVEGERVSLLANVVSTEQDPALDVQSIEPLDGPSSSGNMVSRATVKLACHLPGACIPFYAIVSWPSNASAPNPAAFTSFANRQHAAQATALPILMRQGARATLVMDDGRARVEMSVISLEKGPAGRIIRVASPDRKHTYTAEIVSANVLKGSF